MDLFKYLFLINRCIKKEVRKKLKGKLNFLEFKVLLTIYKGVDSQNDIVEEIGLSKGTVSKALKGLERAGFVVRKRVGKKYVVELTEIGREIIQEFESVMDDLEKKMLKSFEKDEIAVLKSFFRKMIENLREK